MAENESDRMIHTPVTNFLDELQVPYRIKYHSKPVFTSEDAARERGVHLSQIVKTMLLINQDGAVFVAVLPAHKKLDLKKLKKLTASKELQLMGKESIEKTTHLIVGAVAPVGSGIEVFPVLVDPSVFDEEFLDISSGDPQAGLELHRNVLRELLKEATLVDITKEQK
jgi:Cys-tRNA(Pro)/Cys-tRNA(Cys) deacylase